MNTISIPQGQNIPLFWRDDEGKEFLTGGKNKI